MKKAVIIIVLLMHCCEIGALSDKKKAHEIDTLLKTYYKQGLFDGSVLVARKGEIVYKNAYGIANREWDVPMTTETKFKIGSISKPFTALIILQLVNEGRLSLEGTIADYLPLYQGKGKDQITIGQLLTHTSGLLDCIPAEQEAVKERLYHSLEDLLHYSEEADLYFEPGTGFHYSNLGYSMLALIAEHVTQTSFGQLLKERIFDPVGMADSKQDMDLLLEKRLATGYEYDLLNGYENTTFFDNSYAAGAGGITSTVDDLYKWYLALQSGEIISGALREKMYMPSKKGACGYGWFINEKVIDNSKDTIRIIDHTGSVNGFGSYIAQIPEDSIVVIVLKNARTHNYIRPAFSATIGQEIISLLYNEAVKTQKKSIALTLGLAIGQDGINQAINEYYQMKKHKYQDYDFEEAELNKLGIELYFKYKMTEEALKIFEINMLEYPKSYNTYDSFAYMLMQKQDYSSSIKYYRKGLEILQKYPEENKSQQIQEDAQKALEYITEMEQKLNTTK
jgi:CubicO group peptidase (beta-lactamase class C family)